MISLFNQRSPWSDGTTKLNASICSTPTRHSRRSSFNPASASDLTSSPAAPPSGDWQTASADVWPLLTPTYYSLTYAEQQDTNT
jgi:hypothetical protein